ncbi:MAG: hypothetical protein EAZ08_07435 [Cytophagales bacterium]|nr:MAG: hypothetical protein EAZ08_07435 [Cytophagales bacterium]
MINENATDTNQELPNERKRNKQKITTIVNTVACSLLFLPASGAAMMSPMIVTITMRADSSFAEILTFLLIAIIATYPITIVGSIVNSWGAYKKGNEKTWKASLLAPWVHLLCGGLLMGLFALIFNE